MSTLTERPSHKAYLWLSIPLIISTITTPLLGAVDTAIVGHLHDPSFLGGTAISTLIFNTMYWLFGFLRVSTSGFAAQARGKGDLAEGSAELIRPLLVAALLGSALIALQQPILNGSLSFMKPEPEVARSAAVYFNIRIWGAPLTLINYVLLGWLMGMSHIKYTLIMQVSMNVLNILLALVFVQGLHFGVAGVAAATLFAEGLALLLGCFFVLRSPYMHLRGVHLRGQFAPAQIRRMFKANSDLFIRTVCLLAMFNLFTAQSTTQGTTMLAANSILLQIHYLIAYFFDGFANASSIYAGQARGSGNRVLLQRTLHLSWIWAGLTSIVLAAGYQLFKEPLFALFTDNRHILQITSLYDEWLLLFPLVTGAGLVLYGVFTGMTHTAPIRNSMLLSLSVFVLGVVFLVPGLGNHGLWLSFILFGLGRSVFLLIYIPDLVKKGMSQAP